MIYWLNPLNISLFSCTFITKLLLYIIRMLMLSIFITIISAPFSIKSMLFLLIFSLFQVIYLLPYYRLENVNRYLLQSQTKSIYFILFLCIIDIILCLPGQLNFIQFIISCTLANYDSLFLIIFYEDHDIDFCHKSPFNIFISVICWTRWLLNNLNDVIYSIFIFMGQSGLQ